jgi:hypothetical protein
MTMEVEALTEDQAKRFITEDLRKYRARIERIAEITDIDDLEFEILEIVDKTDRVWGAGAPEGSEQK